MKQLLKNVLKWINDFSVTIFARFHFRKQAKKYCSKNSIPRIEENYACDIKEYWREYVFLPTTVFHKWYSGCNGIKDIRYIPEDFFYDVIERHYNDMSLEPAYVNKGMYRILYPEIKQPVTVFVNMNGIFYDANYVLITRTEAVSMLKQVEKVIIKPTRDTGGGRNVQLIKTRDIDEEKCSNLLREYIKDYIVQIPVEQHPDLAIIHKESLNTIRVMSMLENGNVLILSSVLRMGIGNSFVDNECSGGINCGIDESGHLSKVAYDGSGKIYSKHPQGFEFGQGIIPNYDRIINTIKDQHKKLPYFGLISWDFSIDVDGAPVMIELNLRWCGLNFHQLHHGPLFGDRTDEILKKVYNT